MGLGRTEGGPGYLGSLRAVPVGANVCGLTTCAKFPSCYFGGLESPISHSRAIRKNTVDSLWRVVVKPWRC